MSRTLFYLLLSTFAILIYIHSAASADSKNSRIKDQNVTIDARDSYDLYSAMNECNDSFSVEMSYLESLNMTGSFPDETDKTPKCFLRCVLQNMKIASPEGQYDPELTAIVFAGERNGTPMDGIKEIATKCAKQSTDTCLCERAYSYLKCLFSTEIEKYEMNSKQ